MKYVSLHKNATLRREYLAQTPTWRQPAVGYLLSIPLVGLALLGALTMQNFFTAFYFPGSILTLSVLFSALAWGVGPALFSLLLCLVALDYFLIPPTWHLDINTLNGLAQLVPFAISGIVIALITAQRERARLRALYAEHEATTTADELEESNQKLQEANELKDRFLSIASHELKTPITTIRGQAQLVLRRLGKQREISPEMEGMKKTLEKINEQTGRLTALIDELMDVSSIRSGKMELHKHECDLAETCQSIIEDQQMLTGRTITLVAAKEHIALYADCNRLSQVIVNLISNAIKYSPEEYPVEVHLSEEPEFIHIDVIDHGKGIAKNQQERIFETFYRTHDAQNSAKGLGLGLAISKDIVERHNGRIWCQSEQGKGSVFMVELPRR